MGNYKMIKQLFLALACMVATAEASIFWEKLKGFFNDLSSAKFQEVVAWQVAGLFIPLVAGPMRVAASLMWNTDQGQATDYFRAYMYFYDITSIDQFWGYFMDYTIYGKIYPVLPGFSTDFYEIPLLTLPDDILCYNLNGYDPVSNPGSVPTYGQNSVATAAGVTCTSAVVPGSR